jgi:hypothetical protein
MNFVAVTVADADRGGGRDVRVVELQSVGPLIEDFSEGSNLSASAIC